MPFKDDAGRGSAGPDSFEQYRERVIDQLTSAYAADRIRVEQFENSVGEVQKAGSPGELEEIVQNLPVAIQADAAGRSAPDSAARSQSQNARGGRKAGTDTLSPDLANPISARLSGGPGQSLFCVMGERQLHGDWLPGDSVSSFCLMGSTVIDFRDTALPPGPISMALACFMGDITIIVPPGLPVLLNAVPFMGDASVGRDIAKRPIEGRPYLSISGFVMMGDIQIKQKD